MSQSSKSHGVVLLGATSAIAEAYARLKVRGPESQNLFLVGRNIDQLEAIAADLRTRGAADVHVHAADLAAAASEQIETLVQVAQAALGQIDEVLIAYGSLPDQTQTQIDPDALENALRVNFTSTALWLQAFANVMVNQGTGRIGVIGSVAGDRGRMSNFAYGAAKGGLARFVQGLQHALASHKEVSVTLIKPGFVITPMTAHIEGRGGLLWANPDRVARDILKAVQARRRQIYTPWFWWAVMLIIRMLPNAIMHKTKL